MTGNAVRLVAFGVRGRMATRAYAVVEGGIVLSEDFVRGVTAQAGELSAALFETGALTEVHGLEAHVPGVIPIES